VSFYVSKPVRFSFLIERISELIDDRNRSELQHKIESQIEEEYKESHKKILLLADDDAFSSGILKTLLEKENFKCLQTYSVKEVKIIYLLFDNFSLWN
jgi:hypothetical protein